MKLRVTYVGAVSRTRGAGLMFESMKLLQEMGCPIELTILGPWHPPDVHWIEERVARFKGIVRATGRVSQEQVAAALEESDVGLFLFLPMEEVEWIYPIKVYEYMVYGVPPICTDLAGVRDIVTDGVNGFILRSPSPTSLADLLVRLATDRLSLEKMRDRARKRAEDFDWPRIHREFYRDITRRLALPAGFEAPVGTAASA